MPKTPEDIRAYQRAWKRAWRAKGDNRARERAQIYAGRRAHPERYHAVQHASHQRHKATRNAKSKAYRAAHLEELTVYHYNYYRQHIEESKAYNKTYNLTNAEANRLYNAQYREANKARLLRKEHAYRLAHPEVGMAHGVRRRGRKRELPIAFSTTEQSFCRAYFHYACAACGNENGFEWTIGLDHWIPLNSTACPGTIATNMIPLCHGLGGCNNTKSDKAPEQWLLERFGTRKAAVILKRIHAYFALVAGKD